MRRKREMGYCEVAVVNGGGAWHLPRSEFAPVLTAWMKGALRVATTEFYGDALTIDLTRVESISDVSPEGLAARLADTRQNEADDSLAVS